MDDDEPGWEPAFAKFNYVLVRVTTFRFCLYRAAASSSLGAVSSSCTRA